MKLLLSALLCAMSALPSLAGRVSGITKAQVAASLRELLEKDENAGGLRIVGGNEVTSGRGFMVHLVYGFWDFFGDLDTFPSGNIKVAALCGGSLIGPDTVLSAAHCEDPYDVNGPTYQPVVLFAKIGTFDTAIFEEDLIDVTDFIRHPSYNDFRNDLAILPLAESSTATPIDLIFESSNYASAENAGTSTFVAGWGTLFEGGSASDVPDQLKEVEMPVLADSECTAVYGSGYDSSIMLCSGAPYAGRDSCQGDSGGPLFAEPVGGGREVQVGIVSFGIGCAREGIPGVYTRVSAYQSWIESQATLAAPPVGNGASGFSTFVYDPNVPNGTRSPTTPPPTFSPSSAPSDMAVSVLLASAMMLVALLH